MPANGQGEVESNVPILQRLWIVLDSLKTYPGLVQLNAKQGSNVLFCSIRTLLVWSQGCAYFFLLFVKEGSLYNFEGNSCHSELS